MSTVFLESDFKDIIFDIESYLEESTSTEETGKLYFLLINTGSLIANMISKVTNAPYTHVSVAFDEKLKDLYSFNVDVNGIKKEILEVTYQLTHKMSIYFVELPVSIINKIRERVQLMISNSKQYSYDLTSVVKFLIPKRIRERFGDSNSDDDNRNSFICSQFASWLLLAHNIKLFSRKDNMLLSPYDFMKSKITHLYYRGTVGGFISRNR